MNNVGVILCRNCAQPCDELGECVNGSCPSSPSWRPVKASGQLPAFEAPVLGPAAERERASKRRDRERQRRRKAERAAARAARRLNRRRK